MNWLASSTASHSTRLIPAASSSRTSVSMHCRAWPNSWKIVSTSLRQSLHLPPSSGRGKFVTIVASGFSPLRTQRLRNSFIHAPPCFSPFLTYGSR